MPYKTAEKKRIRHAAYMKERYHSDEAFRNKYKAACAANWEKQRARVRLIVAAAKSGGCRVCGEPERCCLAFHHVDPKLKRFGIGSAASNKVSPQTLLREIAKCVCVCHNCHAKIHAGLIDSPTIFHSE